MKFKLSKEEIIIRNIQFPKDLFHTMNSIKKDISLNKFVIQAIEYALDNIED